MGPLENFARPRVDSYVVVYWPPPLPPVGDMGPGVPLLINESAHIYAIFNECIFMQYAVFIHIIMH